MKLKPVIDVIKARCLVFNGNVGGVAEFSVVEDCPLPAPAAYVIPLDDRADDNDSSNSVRQGITDAFTVVVELDVTAKQEPLASTEIHDIRTVLWAALLNWSPDPDVYYPIVYEGGGIHDWDRSRLLYRFGFAARGVIDASDGYQETFDDLNTVHVDLEPLDPVAPAKQPDDPPHAGMTINLSQP